MTPKAEVPPAKRWAVGVDLGGTKILVARVGSDGKMSGKVRLSTEVSQGPAAVKAEIISGVERIISGFPGKPFGVGVGVAGQVDARTGTIRFAPNLG
ncbi:MAG TPA: ROK family protein, partial [Thermodesulfobacteriota bacterium]|nr:ROK family protein [Thermodesulfobacteriota bacterium]